MTLFDMIVGSAIPPGWVLEILPRILKKVCVEVAAPHPPPCPSPALLDRPPPSCGRANADESVSEEPDALREGLPARIGPGSDGQASTTAARSGSVGSVSALRAAPGAARFPETPFLSAFFVVVRGFLIRRSQVRVLPGVLVPCRDKRCQVLTIPRT